MATQKPKEIAEGGQPHSAPGGSPRAPVPTAPKLTSAAKKSEAAYPGVVPPPEYKQPLPVTRLPVKPAADTRPTVPQREQRPPPSEQSNAVPQEVKKRNSEVGSNELKPADDQKPSHRKSSVPETFQSHVVNENVKALNNQQLRYSRQRRYPPKERPFTRSLWNPMAQHAKTPAQSSSGQYAASQTAYIVPNYVCPPEGPPDSEMKSIQMALIGVLIAVILVTIISWTLITLRRSNLFKGPAGQYNTEDGDAPSSEVSKADPEFPGSSVGPMQFSRNVTLSGEELANAEDSDVDVRVVTKGDTD